MDASIGKSNSMLTTSFMHSRLTTTEEIFGDMSRRCSQEHSHFGSFLCLNSCMNLNMPTRKVDNTANSSFWMDFATKKNNILSSTYKIQLWLFMVLKHICMQEQCIIFHVFLFLCFTSFSVPEVVRVQVIIWYPNYRNFEKKITNYYANDLSNIIVLNVRGR